MIATASVMPGDRMAPIAEPELVGIVDEQPHPSLTPAVAVRGVVKSFHSWFPSSKSTNVLHDVTFTIQRGAICGLLGPSGCGKTTLLNCLVGQTKMDSGSILLFGHPTGSKESGVPGRSIGFMPQDISLSFDLKVGETLHFYGKLLGMTSTQITEKSDFLLRLLELPPLDRFIDSLSGGQQRKVSLAITLIHDPLLLILDEPTVGVDPIVRKRIWDHLFELASNNKQTIIITTHYIEEAVNADTVEMMYEGTIICEGRPRDVIERNNCLSLEAVFLKLCLKLNRKSREAFQKRERKPELASPLLISCETLTKHTSGHQSVTLEMSPMSRADDDVLESNDDDYVENVPAETKETSLKPQMSYMDHMRMCFRLPTYRRVRALTICNLRKSYRHAGHFLVHVIVPCVILTIFYFAFGGFPKNISIAVINDDKEQLGGVLLSHINTVNIVQKPCKSFEEGRRAVEIGDAWGVLQVQANFSDSLYQRVMYGTAASDAVINSSSLRLALDVTCHPVTMVILDTLEDAFIKFGLDLLKGTGLEPGIVSSPLTFSYDIFERNTNGLMGFAAPGIIMCAIYFVAMANCILSLLSDKSCGQFLRNIVAGVTEMELLLGHTIAFSLAVLIQSITYIVLGFYILGIPCAGPVYSVFLLIVLHGICGTSFGLFVSTFCESDFTAVMLGFGTFLPSVCLSGVVWPIESIPSVLQGICRLLPQSYVVDSLRGIMARGWEIYHPIVVAGFAANVAWLIIFLFLSCILLKIRLAILMVL